MPMFYSTSNFFYVNFMLTRLNYDQLHSCRLIEDIPSFCLGCRCQPLMFVEQLRNRQLSLIFSAFCATYRIRCESNRIGWAFKRDFKFVSNSLHEIVSYLLLSGCASTICPTSTPSHDLTYVVLLATCYQPSFYWLKGRSLPIEPSI